MVSVMVVVGESSVSGGVGGVGVSVGGGVSHSRSDYASADSGGVSGGAWWRWW